jgi:hypothetical protein
MVQFTNSYKDQIGSKTISAQNSKTLIMGDRGRMAINEPLLGVVDQNYGGASVNSEGVHAGAPSPASEKIAVRGNICNTHLVISVLLGPTTSSFPQGVCIYLGVLSFLHITYSMMRCVTGAAIP